MVTKTTHTKTKVASSIEAKTQTADVVGTDSFTRAYARFNAAMHDVLIEIKMPSTLRQICAFMASLCVGYGIGWLASFVIEATMLASFVATGSATLSLLVWLAGFVLAFIAAYKVGGYIGMAVYTGDFDKFVVGKYNSSKRWVRSLFSNKPIEMSIPREACGA